LADTGGRRQQGGAEVIASAAHTQPADGHPTLHTQRGNVRSTPSETLGSAANMTGDLSSCWLYYLRPLSHKAALSVALGPSLPRSMAPCCRTSAGAGWPLGGKSAWGVFGPCVVWTIVASTGCTELRLLCMLLAAKLYVCRAQTTRMPVSCLHPDEGLTNLLLCPTSSRASHRHSKTAYDNCQAHSHACVAGCCQAQCAFVMRFDWHRLLRLVLAGQLIAQLLHGSYA
jgi:hypothetical protein